MSRPVRFLDTPHDAPLAALLSSHRTLEHAVRHWLSQAPPVDVTDVVTQDEFTHDVLVRLPDRRVVVYDAT